MMLNVMTLTSKNVLVTSIGDKKKVMKRFNYILEFFQYFLLQKVQSLRFQFTSDQFRRYKL